MFVYPFMCKMGRGERGVRKLRGEEEVDPASIESIWLALCFHWSPQPPKPLVDPFQNLVPYCSDNQAAAAHVCHGRFLVEIHPAIFTKEEKRKIKISGVSWQAFFLKNYYRIICG